MRVHELAGLVLLSPNLPWLTLGDTNLLRAVSSSASMDLILGPLPSESQSSSQGSYSTIVSLAG